MSVVIPLGIGIFYTIVYFVAGPTGIYVVLRSMKHEEANLKFLMVRGFIYIPFGFASALHLIHTIRIQHNNAIQSNHILNTTLVMVTIVGKFGMAIILYAFGYFKYFDSPDITIILIPLSLQAVKAVFTFTIVLTHNSVRNHLSNFCLIRNFCLLWSVRQSRHVSLDQRNLELHGVPSKSVKTDS